MLDRLARRNLHDFAVYNGRLGLLISLEAPRIKRCVTEHIHYLSVVLIAAGFDREANRTRALVLGGGSARNDLELLYGLDRNACV